MGPGRSLPLAAALLLLSAALVSGGPLSQPQGDGAQTAESSAGSDDRTDTSEQTEPVPVKNAGEQSADRTGSEDGTETAADEQVTGQPGTAVDRTQNKIFGANGKRTRVSAQEAVQDVTGAICHFLCLRHSKYFIFK